jgi:hypothetical protein
MIATTARPRRRRKPVVVLTPPTAAIDAPYTPSPEFTRAYSQAHGPEAAVWSEDSRYMTWTLETCQMGSRLRNRANPTNT